MEMTKVIAHHDSGMTSEEKSLNMLHQMEKQFNTGPIIGEARELVLHLIHNLYCRDLFLDTMNVPVEKREGIFKMICELEEEQDNKILKERESKNEGNSN